MRAAAGLAWLLGVSGGAEVSGGAGAPLPSPGGAGGLYRERELGGASAVAVGAGGGVRRREPDLPSPAPLGSAGQACGLFWVRQIICLIGENCCCRVTHLVVTKVKVCSPRSFLLLVLSVVFNTLYTRY